MTCGAFLVSTVSNIYNTIAGEFRTQPGLPSRSYILKLSLKCLKTHEFSTNFNDSVISFKFVSRNLILHFSYVCAQTALRHTSCLTSAAVLTSFRLPLESRLFFNRDVLAVSTPQLVCWLLIKVIYRTKLSLRILTKRTVESHSFYFQFCCLSSIFKQHAVEPYSRYLSHY